MGKRVKGAAWSASAARGLAGFLLAALAGCAPGAGTATSSRSATIAAHDPSASAATALHLPPEAAEITTARHLDFRRDVEITDVTRARFRRVIRGALAHAPLDDEDATFVRAFGFAPLEAQPSREATVRAVEEGLVGLYVPAARAIYLHARSSAPPESNREAVLIHELVHAAQDDRFGLEGVHDASLPVDEQLARRAVVEGDATVSTLVVLGARAGESATESLGDREMLWRAQAMVAGSAQEIEFQSDAPPSNALNRATTYFPYTAGAFFVAQVLRAGGADLVSRVFGRLPATTEQILHPEKYFEGELPIPVAEPVAPPGWVVVAGGRLGELRARIFLGLTLSIEKSIPATTGWGGDAYAVLARPGSDRPALLWSTVWDDEASAARFADALEEATRCKGDDDACPLGPTAIRRRGARVSWVRGLVETDAPLDALLRLPGLAPPPKPPLGAIRAPIGGLPPNTIVPLTDSRVTVAPLALRARVPAGFDLLRVRGQDMVVDDRRHHGRGAIEHATGTFDDAQLEATRATMTVLFSSTHSGLRSEPAADVALPIGRGRELRWSFPDGRGSIKVNVVPLCEGRKILTIVRVARTEEAMVLLAQWAQSIEPTQAGVAPICEEARRE